MGIAIKARDFFAIKKADIILDGITVISGVNGCGKSTLARSTYELLSAAINYDDLVANTTKRLLFEMKQSLRSAMTNMSGFAKRSDVSKLQIVHSGLYFRDQNNEKYLEFLDSLIQLCYEVQRPLSSAKKRYYDSFCNILCSVLKRPYHEDLSAEELLSDFKIKYIEIQKNSDFLKLDRKMTVFQQQWNELFGQKLNPSLFNVFENDVPVVDGNRNVVLYPDSIKNIFYVDTPMSLMDANAFVLDDTKKHWTDLNKVFWGNRKFDEPFNFYPNETGGLLNGNFDWNEDKSSLIYKTSDEGPVFDVLKRGATGLKSFVIMQSLYRKGLINQNTLLILDEPEAHLHPQWIVHFAKFLVMLRKETRCTFLISSHSTDMVSSLKFIAEKELKQKTRYYLADLEDDKRLLYSFKNLNDDIEPIFEKFNKSFRIMDGYSEENQEIADL